MSKIKKRLSSPKGETILETLVALLIIALTISFLSASIAKTAGIQNDIKKTTESGFTYTGQPVEGATISDDKGFISVGRTVAVYEAPQYESEGKNVPNYYYYEP